MMDPFTYRKQLTLPKLLIVGTNDPYWTCDAMNLYWDDLVGRKFIRQVPNAGHSLKGGRDGAFATLAVFFRHVAASRPLPTHSWSMADGGNRLKLTMTAMPAPSKVRFWKANSRDLDFRGSEWTSTELSRTGDEWIGATNVPEGKHVAVFGELEFQLDGHPWSLTTLVYRR